MYKYKCGILLSLRGIALLALHCILIDQSHIKNDKLFVKDIS
jgi:hypothetical protein